MKLQYVFIPLVIGSAALAGWIAIGPEFVESTPAAISLDPSAGFEEAEKPAVVVGDSDLEIDPETGFAIAAFPPTIPDREWHLNAWLVNNCLDCHETGVGDAPMIRHKGLPDITYKSMCRSCHVLIPGQADYVAGDAEFDPETGFASWAFPPMMPNNDKHEEAWGSNNCLMCHESGALNAPVVKHKGLPRIALKAQCRSCHVQIRSHTQSPFDDAEYESLVD